MSSKPDAVWVEAARIAADQIDAALGPMDNLILNMVAIDDGDLPASNSAKASFLDYLECGGHLDDTFLANAR